MKLDSINRTEAFRYLGYGTNRPDDNILNLSEECEQRLLEVIDAKYVFRYFPLEHMHGGGLAVPGTQLVLEGSSIKEHLEGCAGVVLFAATLSEGVDRLIRRLTIQSMSEAMITDSMASAAIEQICDMAEQDIMKEFAGRHTTWRFSPGYGDFPLECQRMFLDVLMAPKRIGVSITRGGVMTPCKSVTAVIGISDNEVENKRRGCTVCSMREHCDFRRKGGHCGF